MASSSPPEDDRPADDEFPMSAAAGSLLRRFRPLADGDTPATPPPEPVSPTPGDAASDPAAIPFTVEDLDSVDLAYVDADQATPVADDPAAALIRIEERMARTKRELAAGKINQAQFQAVYTHYAEQKALIRRLISRSQRPDAVQSAVPGAVQRVVAAGAGHTGFLRRHHEARLKGLAVFDNQSGMRIKASGAFEVSVAVIAPLLDHLEEVENAPIPGGEARFTQIAGGRWLAYVSGHRTTTMAVFSAEPSARQLARQFTLHYRFESDNEDLLRMGYLDPEALTFPQQALFER